MKKIFIILGLSATFALNSQAAVVEYWDFEDGSVGANFTPEGTTDGSGGSTGANGTLMRGKNSENGPSWVRSPLTNGGSLEMDCNAESENGYTSEGALHNWTSPTWTLEMHVYFDDFDSGWCTMVSRDGSSFEVSESDFYLQRCGDDGKIRIQYPRADATSYQDGINSLRSSTTLLPGQWYGIAVICDAKNLSIWIDEGKGYNLDASTDVSGNVNNGIFPSNLNWVFGRGWYNSNADHTDAQYDNIRFSDTALPPDQLIALNPAGTRIEENGMKPIDWPELQSEDNLEFYLERETWDKRFNDHTGCPILRELVRQSLLVSAELDRGYIPRDAAMGDPVPANRAGPELSLHCEFAEQLYFNYKISLKGKEEEPLVSQSIPSSFYDATVYPKVLEVAERQARELFSEADDHHSAQSTPSTTDLYRIKNLDFLTLWKQLREWDEEIRVHGETPERLSALARGYSTLGMATYSIMSSTPKACLARGLVFAQRMVVKYPDNPSSYYTSAYAWTLAGMEIPARDHLEKAEQLNGEPPSWAGILYAYLDSDLNQLEEQMNLSGFNGQLAGMLGAFATHNNFFSERFVSFAEPTIEKNPQNIQLFHLYNNSFMGGLNVLRWASSAGFDVMDAMLGQRLFKSRDSESGNKTYDVYGTTLQHITESGEILRSAPSEPPQYIALFEELMEQQKTDQQTPSTASLAHVIRDNRFMLTYFRLEFMKVVWAVDVKTTLAELLPQIANHPYAPLLETFVDGADVKAITKKVEIGYDGHIFYQFLINDIIRKVKPDFANMDYQTASLTGHNNRDRNGFDFTLYLSEENMATDHHKKLLASCPNHFAATLFTLWDEDVNITEFLEKHRDLIESSAYGTYMLGKRYLWDNHPEQARAMYEKSLKLRPSYKTVQALAELCLEQGDQTAWMEYMIESLDFPNMGLEDAKTQVEIADELLKQGDLDKALQFAEAAAGSYAEWALDKAAWVNGVLGNKQQSIDYLTAKVGRYGLSDNLYSCTFIFGLQLDSIMERLHQKYLNDGRPISLKQAAAIDFGRNKPEQAVALFQQALERSNDPWEGLWGALVCEDQGWIERRDKILQETLNRFPDLKEVSDGRKGLYSFVKLYTQINETGTLSEEQIKAINAFASDFSDDEINVDAHAFAGELLRLKGRTDLAEKIFLDIISTEFKHRIIEFLPYLRLREMGIDPIQLLRERTTP